MITYFTPFKYYVFLLDRANQNDRSTRTLQKYQSHQPDNSQEYMISCRNTKFVLDDIE